MIGFSTGELEALRDTQTGAMLDACQIFDQVEGASDAWGRPEVTYAARESGGEPIEFACGYNPHASREALTPTDVPRADAALRLPIGTTIDATARVKITTRDGEALATPPIYEIVGRPERGRSGLVLALRLVTDGSV